jgi:hypothetical protein
MATYTSTQAGTNKTANSGGWAGVKQIAIGTIPDVSAAAGTATVTTGPVSGDIYRMVKVPKGAVVVGGRVFGSRMSSGTSYGSSSLSFNCGFSGAIKTLAGVSYGATTTSNALGAIIPNYADVSGITNESGLNHMLGGLLYTVGPLEVTEDQFVQLKVTGTAVSFVSAGCLSLEVEYYMRTHS